jgi:hypothetical protein
MKERGPRSFIASEHHPAGERSWSAVTRPSVHQPLDLLSCQMMVQGSQEAGRHGRGGA